MLMLQKTELSPDFAIRKLRDGDLVSGFDCGDDDLNDFLFNEAKPYRKELLAETYVLVKVDNPTKIIAFCSLANDKVSIDNFKSTTDFNHFRRKQGFPQSKRMKSYPAVKFCRLGVDVSMRGLAAGTRFIDFVKSFFSCNNKTG